MLLRGCSPSAECISALGRRPPAKLPYLTREPFRLVVTQQEVGRAQGGRGRRQGVGQCQPQDPGCLKGFRAPGVKALVNPRPGMMDPALRKQCHGPPQGLVLVGANDSRGCCSASWQPPSQENRALPPQGQNARSPPPPPHTQQVPPMRQSLLSQCQPRGAEPVGNTDPNQRTQRSCRCHNPDMMGGGQQGCPGGVGEGQ